LTALTTATTTAAALATLTALAAATTTAAALTTHGAASAAAEVTLHAAHGRTACTAAEAAAGLGLLTRTAVAAISAAACAAGSALSLCECDTASEGERQDSNCHFVHRFVPFKLFLVGMVYGTPSQMSSIISLRTSLFREIYMGKAFF
jgi:hypothetical protein